MISILPPSLRRRLAHSPRLLLHSLDFERMEARFVHMSRRTFRASSFLDRRIITTTPFTFSAPCKEWITDENNSTSPPVYYIFHVAFCGSTLLARSLDRRHLCLSYKEPMALAQYSQNGGELPPDVRARVLRGIVTSLSKTFHTGEVPLIKLNNLCSFAVGELLESNPRSRGLFLYSDLRTFLCSILPFPERRAWVHQYLAITSRLAEPAGILTGVDVTDTSDAEATACLWLQQMLNYLDLVNAGNDSVASLHSELFLGQPERALSAVNDFFGLGISEDDVTRIVSGDTFNTYSKPVPRGRLGKLLSRVGLYHGPPPRQFDKIERAKSLLLAESQFAEEIALAVAWVETMTRHQRIPKILPRALVE